MKNISTILLLKAVQSSHDVNKKIEIHLSLNYRRCPAVNSSVILECERNNYKFVVKDVLHYFSACFDEESYIRIIASDLMCDSEYDLIDTYEEIRLAYDGTILESPANFSMPNWYRLYRWVLDSDQDLYKTIVSLQETADCVWWNDEYVKKAVALQSKENPVKATYNIIEALTLDVRKLLNETVLDDAINLIVSQSD